MGLHGDNAATYAERAVYATGEEAQKDAIGYGLDYLFSTTFLRFVFLILGVVSGIVQLIRILSRDMK